MKKASIVVSDFYKNNNFFNLEDTKYNRDNSLYAMYVLKNTLALSYNIELNTHDINHPNESEFVLYVDIEERLPTKKEKEKSFLIIFESEVINKKSWNKAYHSLFSKIFTWNDDLIDNIKYFKINFPQHLYFENKIPFHNKKLCALIAGNKTNNHRYELYSERVKAIEWFEKNHSEDFDLYGTGWNAYRKLNNKLFNSFIKRIPWLKFFFIKKYKTYKGTIISKNKVFQKYRFAICYENANSIPGYITEKIFDCFFAGCIPIYLGPPNISIHIPSGCYLDKNDFKSYEELYLYIKKFQEAEYLKYISQIEKFIYSEKFHQFSVDFFINQIVNNILHKR